MPGAFALFLLLSFVVQAWTAARRDSVTIDEFAHLPVGLYTLYTGDFRQDPINPPLARMIAALPLLLHPPAFDPQPGMSQWSLGYLFMTRNASHYQALYLRGRAMIIALAVLLALLLHSWARQLYGWQAGLTALFLFSFSPSMLAHAHLVTLDLAGALGFAATLWSTWRLLERPTLARALLLGAALGLATLLKLSGFVLVGAVLACVAVCYFGERGDPGIGRWLWLLAAAALACLLVLNAGYGFEGTFAPFSSIVFDPGGRLAALAKDWPWLRLPLPRPFLRGVDLVLNVGKGHEASYFLAGRLSSNGWWYYHLAAFAVKSPLPLLVLSLLSFAAWVARRSSGVREYCLFLPVVIVFLANALFNSLQIGVRHVLAVYPLLFLVASGLLARIWQRRREGWRAGLAAALAASLLLWYACGTIAVAPRYLQYFNEIAGGPQRGHRLLIDSNLDWGQDLIRLREYMASHDLERVQLAYFGRVHPAVYGVRFTPLERGAHGTAVVSASFLMGRPYFWFWRGAIRWVPAGTYTWLQAHKPVDRVGSMFVFDLP